MGFATTPDGAAYVFGGDSDIPGKFGNSKVIIGHARFYCLQHIVLKCIYRVIHVVTLTFSCTMLHKMSISLFVVFLTDNIHCFYPTAKNRNLSCFTSTFRLSILLLNGSGQQRALSPVPRCFFVESTRYAQDHEQIN